MQARNPYAAPEAKLADPAAGPGSPLKAVVLGTLVDLGGSMLSGMVLVFVYGIYLAVSGSSAEQIESAVQSPEGVLLYVSSAIGCLFSVLGGYVCARIARQSEYRLGAIMAVVSALLGGLLAWGATPGLRFAILTALSMILVVVGAHLGKSRNTREHR